MEREKHPSSQDLLQLSQVQPEQGFLTGVWTTYRSSLRPKTLMSRQHSFISLVVAAWDSRSLLSKMIWIRETEIRSGYLSDLATGPTGPCSPEISPRWLWPRNPRGFQLSEKLWSENCGRVSDLHLCIPPPGTQEQLLSKCLFCETSQNVVFVLTEQLLCIDLKASWSIHTFGFLTGISSLTVLACTSTSLKACLGSKNLLSILSGARKPGKEIKQCLKKKKPAPEKSFSTADVHVTATNPDRQRRSLQTHF